MRALTLQVQLTADGFMAERDGGIGWMTLPWSDDLTAYVGALSGPVDLILLGRVLAEEFIPYWASHPEAESPEAAAWMNARRKLVISRSLAASPWENADVAPDLVPTVRRLKAQRGGDILAYGGSTLLRSLIAARLVDELYLFVNPVAIGDGLSLFPTAGAPHPLRLLEARRFDCGIALQRYAAG